MNSKTAQWRRIYCVLVAFEVQSCFITLATLVIQILSLAKRSPWKNVLMRLRNTQFWHCQFSNCKKAALKVRTNTVSVKVFNIPIVIQLWRLAHLDSRWCRRSCDIIKLPAACSWCFHTKQQTQDEIWNVFVSARGGEIEIKPALNEATDQEQFHGIDCTSCLRCIEDCYCKACGTAGLFLDDSVAFLDTFDRFG